MTAIAPRALQHSDFQVWWFWYQYASTCSLCSSASTTALYGQANKSWEVFTCLSCGGIIKTLPRIAHCVRFLPLISPAVLSVFLFLELPLSPSAKLCLHSSKVDDVSHHMAKMLLHIPHDNSTVNSLSVAKTSKTKPRTAKSKEQTSTMTCMVHR